jgi:diguanylate cyclase (GGDEF)-like protein
VFPSALPQNGCYVCCSCCRWQAASSRGSLTIIDLNGLKRYNDCFGHERGDELLRRFSQNLNSLLPEYACLHRLGGDEFALTCNEGNFAQIEIKIADTVNTLHAEGFELFGVSFGTVKVAEIPPKTNSCA